MAQIKYEYIRKIKNKHRNKISFTLNDNLYNLLKEQAEKEDIKLSEYIRQLLEKETKLRKKIF